MVEIDDVRQAIRESGLTQVEISRRTGIKQPTISEFLRGKSGGGLSRWLQVLNILGLTAQKKSGEKTEK